MTDRELLELAAKAAGYGIEWREWITSRVAEFQTIKHKKNQGFFVNGTQWNPLTDDGDALRLAVKLGIGVLPACDGVRGRTAVCANCFGWHVFDDLEKFVDHSESTRRAIVRAAAEIGKGMK